MSRPASLLAVLFGAGFLGTMMNTLPGYNSSFQPFGVHADENGVGRGRLFTAKLDGLRSAGAISYTAHGEEVARADASEGELEGLRVRVTEAQAVVIESRPDRGLLLVRLDLEASPDAASAWVDCRASIRGENGEVWLPLYDPAVSGAVRLLASDGKDNRPCNVSVLGESGRATADQLYRLPRAALGRVTLHVSGYGTRPSALAFEVRPTVRTIAPEQ